MIAIDIKCSQGHLFEGWFDNLDAFEDQKKKKFVACPYCDDTSVTRVLSPVAVKKSRSERKEQLPVNIDYQKLAKEVVDYIHENFEDVGPRFAAEALKIHYGVTEKKNIRGSATQEEEKTLKDEGIEFFKVPFPKKDDEEKKN
jgi:hypothetical protein